jgi:glycosyltransferase involved in cell wall biosynthesis
MVTMCTNRDIYRECRRLGLEQAQNFSWDRCAEGTIKIIQEFTGNGKENDI